VVPGDNLHEVPDYSFKVTSYTGQKTFFKHDYELIPNGNKN
jgi:hypothetical protein